MLAVLLALGLAWPLRLSAATSVATTATTSRIGVRTWLSEEVGLNDKKLKNALDVCEVNDIEYLEDLLNMHNDGTLRAAGFRAATISKINKALDSRNVKATSATNDHVTDGQHWASQAEGRAANVAAPPLDPMELLRGDKRLLDVLPMDDLQDHVEAEVSKRRRLQGPAPSPPQTCFNLGDLEFMEPYIGVRFCARGIQNMFEINWWCNYVTCPETFEADGGHGFMGSTSRRRD